MVWTIVALLAVIGGMELFARFYLGLGDPPLLIADPKIEYMFKPSQDVRRFGNRILYNAYSMRNPDFPRHKDDPREVRVMVIGDSVVNGGSQTDHRDLATTRLQERLSATLRRPVIVGNISAASWGPVNMLEYVRKFGLFDADVLVIVLSGHDYGDAPTYEAVVDVHPSFPSRRPMLAVEEALTRYLLPRLLGAAGPDAGVPSQESPEQSAIELSLSALNELIGLARESGADVLVAQYWDLAEMSGPLDEGHGMIRDVAEAAGASVIQVGPAFRDAIARGEQPFRDVIHPNGTGQRIMEQVLYPTVLQLLEAGESDARDVAPATVPALDTPALAR